MSTSEHAAPQDAPASPSPTAGQASLQLQAYRIISREIILAHFHPGEKLTINGLVARLGLGRTPIREALVMLQDERLVQAIPQSGTYVSRIDMGRAECARYVRETLECQIAIECCAKASPGDIEALRSSNARTRAAAATRDDLGFFEGDNAFHQLLYTIAGRPEASAWLNNLTIPLDRYRWLRVQTERLDWNDILDEHDRITEAIAQRDAHETSFLVSKHLHMILKDQGSVISRFPDYFDNVGERA